MFLVYLITTGLILTAVMVGTSVITIQQITTGASAGFENQVFNVISRMSVDMEVKYSWLSELEISGRMMIWIEDNGTPIRYRGGYWLETDRSVLAERLKEAVKKEEGKNLNRPLISSSKYRSKVYQIEGDYGDSYNGTAAMVKVNGGFRTIIILESREPEVQQIRRQIALYLSIYAAGLVALFFVCRLLVKKSVAPVESGQKRQIEFVAAASHELRSPLAVIRADMAAMKNDRNYIERFADSIERECRRMARLTDDMLVLASADAGNWNVARVPVDIDSLLVDIYEEYTYICEQNGLRFKLSLPEEELPEISGDEGRMRQILSILINNAIAYSDHDGEITLRARADKGGLILEIEDHGRGISDEDKKKVFERFYRVDQSRKDKAHFGLGLSIAKELMELHEGSISVKDTPGGGATFVLKFKS